MCGLRSTGIAHLHFARTVYKSGGAKASARLAYITRTDGTAQRPSERQLQYLRDGREDLVATGTRNLPAWAHDDPQVYFRAAERYEGVNRTAFEEWKITLPHELTQAQNQALVEDLLTTIAGDRLPCTYAFHDPKTLNGQRAQPHIHLLLSARMNDAYSRTPATQFKRWNAKDPARGGARKDPAFWHQGAVYAHRLMISDMLNVYLELNGQVARVHPDSLASRGIARGPEPKLLPSESAAFRESGVASPTMAQVLAIREARAAQPPAEQNNARQYWEQRKQFLGLMRDMTREEQVARIGALRHGMPLPMRQRSQPRVRQEDRSAADLDKRWSRPLLGNKKSMIYHLPTHHNYGDVGPHNQVKFWTEREAMAAGYRVARNDVGSGSDTPMAAGARTVRQVRGRGPQGVPPPSSLAQQLRRLGLRLAQAQEAEAPGHGTKLRIHLVEEERGPSY